MWVTIFYLVFSVAFVFWGYMGQQALDRASPCTITYSEPQEILIPVETSSSDFKLYKYIYGNHKINKNATNVLFLPGKSGL